MGGPWDRFSRVHNTPIRWERFTAASCATWQMNLRNCQNSGSRKLEQGQIPLHVPNVFAVLIEGDQTVFTNLESSPETRGRNCGGGTAAFDVVWMEISKVGVM